jgi:hypothetical protein
MIANSITSYYYRLLATTAIHQSDPTEQGAVQSTYQAYLLQSCTRSQLNFNVS